MGVGAGKPLQSAEPPSSLPLLWEFSHWSQGGKAETHEADPRYHLFMTPSAQGLGPVPLLLWARGHTGL